MEPTRDQPPAQGPTTLPLPPPPNKHITDKATTRTSRRPTTAVPPRRPADTLTPNRSKTTGHDTSYHAYRAPRRKCREEGRPRPWTTTVVHAPASDNGSKHFETSHRRTRPPSNPSKPRQPNTAPHRPKAHIAHVAPLCMTMQSPDASTSSQPAAAPDRCSAPHMATPRAMATSRHPVQESTGAFPRCHLKPPPDRCTPPSRAAHPHKAAASWEGKSPPAPRRQRASSVGRHSMATAREERGEVRAGRGGELGLRPGRS